MPAFARKLVAWQAKHGRHGLPWQGTRDPYRIWLSEIMLQQTQVSTVIPYFERFLARFPDVTALAAADEDAVLRLWSGLGYYARGRNLLAAAREVVRLGGFPDTQEALQGLPGVGRSTAAAIAVFAYGSRAAILDGNVKRVLARAFGTEGDLWELAESLVPARDTGAYTQALMDLGATVCTRAQPACGRCPVAKACVARREGRVAELPARKARKALPLRRQTWLVLEQDGRVLLERRPSPGLWGGLWTFPELTARDARATCRTRFGCTIRAPEKLAPVEHGFTHFRLQAQPLLCAVRARVRTLQEPGRVWLSLAEAAQAAIPVPVRKVLEALAAR
ncbi:MAG: A/G-specific adenine glycosylase [Burkholderiales bacterium]